MMLRGWNKPADNALKGGIGACVLAGAFARVPFLFVGWTTQMPKFFDIAASEVRPGSGSAPLVAYILKQRGIAFRIFLLVLFVGLATIVRSVFGLLIPDTGFFAFYFPAIMVVTILAGWEMGLASIVLSILLSLWLFMLPAMKISSPNFSQSLNIVVFVIAAVLQVALAQWLRNVLSQMERNGGTAIANS